MDNKQALITIRAALIELDKGLLMMHSAVVNITKTIEKLSSPHPVKITDRDDFAGYSPMEEDKSK